MRSVSLFIVLLFASSLLACSPGYPSQKSNLRNTVNQEPPNADPGYPAGFSGWSRFNVQTIFRAEPSEARDLYYNRVASASQSGAFPQGTVLVKAQHTVSGTQKGALFKLSVMTKGTGGSYAGWDFSAYDSKTGKKFDVDQDGCALCHGQRADNDFVFSYRGMP